MRKHRYGVLVTHRRFGKTVMAVNALIRGAVECKKQRPRFGYIAPTYRQGKAIAWDYLQHYAKAITGSSANQQELRVDFPNGGQVRIYGSDNPDSLRGLYFDGVVLDEYGLHPAKTFTEVLGPTLVDRRGWALFVGTPNGKNQFFDIAKHAKQESGTGNADWFFAEYKASQTDLLPEDELERARAGMTEDEYRQEYECSFEAAVRGAIYVKELEAARDEGRIGNVPYDPALPVHTDWDLGVGDSTAIWFSQSVRTGEIRLIDYHEASGEGFPYYAKILQGKGYAYGQHWGPHDIVVRELGTGRSRLEAAREYGIKFEVTPRIHTRPGFELEEGIHAVRMILSRCWFDEKKCGPGIEALQHYRRDYNERLNEFKASPVHDWASHGSDAFRGLAVRHRIPEVEREQRAPRMPQTWSWT